MKLFSESKIEKRVRIEFWNIVIFKIELKRRN